MSEPIQAPARARSPWVIPGVIAGGVVVLGLAVVLAFKALAASGLTQGPDVIFGDQHLKTTVALVELHKLRTGRYPQSLAQLRFTGSWDLIALGNVRYVAAEDGASYYVEVERGWIGKPRLQLPAEFWRGTGYDPALAGAR